jgi:fibro-slime domain-containing protein
MWGNMRRAPRSHLLVVAIWSVLGFGCAKVSQQSAGGPPGGNTDSGLPGLRPSPDGMAISGSIRITCGNGRIDATEGCDDGNTADGDGCTQLCQVESDWSCPAAGQKCTYTARCGDGKLSGNEGCDDGNAAPGDGCGASCMVEAGWQCRVAGKRCVPLCGDSVVTGSETCDDGNTASGDGCSATCLTEPGATCPKPGQPCAVAKCGNGIVEQGEACDQGPQLNGLFYGDGTGCSKTCTKEPKCRTGTVTQACDTSCGNGNIELGEDCDDGNQANGDGCSSTCKAEVGFSCTPELKPDTQDCVGGSLGKCLLLPVIVRDFKSEKEVDGHPDFFYLGTGTGVSPATKRLCVPNSGGPAKANDSTARCWDLAKSGLSATGVSTFDALDAKGKPVFNAARPNGNLCDCQFTDWSHDTNLGHVPGYTILNSPLNGLPYVAGPVGHPQFKGLVPLVKDATSFGQWFIDSPFTGATHSVVTLELSPLAGLVGQYRFSSNPHSVLGGFFPADPPGNLPAPGTVRMTARGEPLLCNLWPYWYSSPLFGAGAGCKGDQYLIPPSIDPQAPECLLGTPPGCPNGMWAPQIQGVFHNSWYSTEARYLFQFNGPFGLQFYGDDDLFIYINGILVLDLGGVHQRLPGRVDVGVDGTATITEGGALDPVTSVIVPCPGADPNTKLLTNATCPGGNCDCRNRTANLGLTMGKTYEIAVFHADRHPTESNYQLTLSGFSTNRSNCASKCGDAVVTGAEECDDGAKNDDTAYNGCTTSCKFGPYCGDGMKTGTEQCDLGRQNGSPYGTRDGCTTACSLPHYCGDAIVDSQNGEMCDQGEALNGQPGSPCNSTCRIIIN